MTQHITVKQMKVLLVFFLIGDMLWFLPYVLTAAARQDAWLAWLIGSVLGIGASVLLYKFWLLFNGLTLIGILETVLGKVAGSIVIVLFLIFLVINACAGVRYIGDFMATQILTETPLRIILLLFLAVVMIAVRSGLTVIARTGQLFMGIFIFLMTMLVLLLLPEIDLNNLKPYLDNELPRLVEGSMYAFLYPYLHLIMLLMILPYVEKQEGTDKAYERSLLRSVVLASAIIFVVIMLSLLVLGIGMTEHNQFATFSMAKKINIGNFLQRLEAIFVISYMLSTFFKCSLAIYAICQGMREWLGLKDYRVMVTPMYFVLLGVSYYLYDNVVQYAALGGPWVVWDSVNVLVFVVLVYIVYLIRGWAERGSKNT